MDAEESYEMECLAAVRSRLRRAATLMPAVGRQFVAVGLRGFPPNTEIFVDYLDMRRPLTTTWKLRDMDPSYDVATNDPEILATLIYVKVTEPAGADDDV